MKGQSAQTSRSRIVQSVLATGALLLTVVSGATTASAGLATAPGVGPSSGSSWSVVASPNGKVFSGRLEATSCSSPTFCEAVGEYVDRDRGDWPLAELWNGTVWIRQTIPKPKAASAVLDGVSCTSSTFCLAIGSDETARNNPHSVAEVWNGSAWSVQQFPYWGTFYGVSCLSPTSCEAVGEPGIKQKTPVAAGWNGTTWSDQTVPGPSGADSSRFSSVSCASAGACEAVGYAITPSGDEELAEVWNGTAWSLQSIEVGGELYGVSCQSASFCEAVGDSQSVATAAQEWNGTSWTAQSMPSVAGYGFLEAVSCQSTTFCQATGNTSNGVTLAEMWDGTDWVIQPTGRGAELSGVSCPSAAACEAVGWGGDAIGGAVPVIKAWNGGAWASQRAAADFYAAYSALSSVSCPTSVFCEAVGYWSQEGGEATAPLVEQWSGISWSRQDSPVIGRSARLTAVSCPSASLCEAVGYYTSTSTGHPAMLVEEWNGKTWFRQSIATPYNSQLNAVSCGSPTSCEAVGSYQNVQKTLAVAWNGTAWSIQPTPKPAGERQPTLESVSCPSSISCEAVGTYGTRHSVLGTIAEAWNGTKWTLQRLAKPSGSLAGLVLPGLSCTSADFCEAVGQDAGAGLVENWNGTTWAVQSVSAPGNTFGLNGVSCTSETSCEAVGDYGASSSAGTLDTLAEMWDGTTWAVQSTPDPAESNVSVLNSVACPASTSCLAFGVQQTLASFDFTLAEEYS